MLGFFFPPAHSLHMSNLQELVTQFREEYARANDHVVLTESAGWAGLWDVVVRHCSDDLTRPGADPFAVRRRLERMADLYRRAMCDPVRLFASLDVQEAVVSGCATLERWVEENTPAPKEAPAIDDLSEHWHLVLSNVAAFVDWPVARCPEQHDARYQWRPPCNLYANPHAGCSPLDIEYGCTRSRRLLLAGSAIEAMAAPPLLASIGETARFLASSTFCATDTIGVTSEDWDAYRAATLRTYGEVVDVELVAVQHCGYPARRDCPNVSTAEWRGPIRDAEECMADMLDRAGKAAGDVVLRWLSEVCGMGRLHAGCKYPPAFTALIADIFAERWLPLTDIRAPSSRLPESDPEPHPYQLYSVWLRYGFLDVPDAAQLTAGWDATDHLALEEAGGRCTSELLDRWRREHHAGVLTVD